jgi:DNA polymerase
VPADLDTATAITSTIRSAFRADVGHELVISDFASIENRVLAWLAKCTPMLDVYRTGRCAYKSFAELLYCVVYEEVTKLQRNQAKPAVLGCGYGMGWARLLDYSKTMGITMTEQEAKDHVGLFRATYPQVPALWSEIERSAFGAVRDKARYVHGSGLEFDSRDPRYLRIGLHSGRSLFYLQPTIGVKKTFYGESESMSYESSGKTGMMKVYTYGARLTENIVQALARDLLCGALRTATGSGFSVIGHIHDEIVCDEQIGSDFTAVHLSLLMSFAPAWAPDMLLAAEGDTSAYYKK